MNRAIGAARLVSTGLFAQQAEVRHKHLIGGGRGSLQVTQEGISFQERGKHEDHSHKWAWNDIQELELGGGEMRVQIYQQDKLNSGRDREYLFDRLPEDFVKEIRPALRRKLPAKFIDAGPVRDSLWENKSLRSHP